jgi:hypothetical protein
MATERNPWLCCPATHLSRNGKCVPGGTQDSCVLSQSGLVIFAESDGSLAAAKASVVRQAATGGLKAGHFVKATEKSQTIKNKDTRDNFLPDERFSLTGTSVGSSEELKACFSGVGCEDAGGCDSANYYSDGTSAMKPYYLLNPGRRCFQFKYEDTGGMTENTTVNNCVECSAPFADLTYINNWRAVSWAAIFGVHTDSASKTEFTTVCTDGKEFDTGSCSEYRKDKSGIDEGDWDSDFISGSCTHAGPWVTSAGGNTCKLDPNAGKSGSEINAHLYGYPIDNDKFTVSCESDTLNDCLGWDDKSDDYRNDHYEEFEGTKQCV